MPSDSQLWHDLAKTARAKADRMKADHFKRRLLAMADFYQQMAKRDEQRSPQVAKRAKQHLRSAKKSK
jgi:hypothetical protein